jgi:hypothetical protein
MPSFFLRLYKNGDIPWVFKIYLCKHLLPQQNKSATKSYTSVGYGIQCDILCWIGLLWPRQGLDKASLRLVRLLVLQTMMPSGKLSTV